MRHRGIIIALSKLSESPEYGIVCSGEEGLFSFPVGERYLKKLIKKGGNILEREIEYDDELDALVFLD